MLMRHEGDDDPGPSNVSVTVSHDGATVLLVVSGEVDLASAPVLAVALDSVAAGAPEVVLDLDGLTFFGSTGINVLVDACRRLGATGTRLRVRCGQPLTRRVIQLCGLSDVLSLSP
jgi:stage II sporulation protein AA (anti-sigma F factor antagonist)